MFKWNNSSSVRFRLVEKHNGSQPRTLLQKSNVAFKITICLDEFSYLVEVPSLIQTLLDYGELKYNIILCGSSQTMMYNLTHDEASPLFGRKEADFYIGSIKLAICKKP